MTFLQRQKQTTTKTKAHNSMTTCKPVRCTPPLSERHSSAALMQKHYRLEYNLVPYHVLYSIQCNCIDFVHYQVRSLSLQWRGVYWGLMFFVLYLYKCVWYLDSSDHGGVAGPKSAILPLGKTYFATLPAVFFEESRQAHIHKHNFDTFERLVHASLLHPGSVLDLGLYFKISAG